LQSAPGTDNPRYAAALSSSTEDDADRNIVGLNLVKV